MNINYLVLLTHPILLKLARNALCELGVFIDGEGKIVQWSCIQKLHEEQTLQGSKFANKLSSNHIILSWHKMNVRLIDQTFSSSVADATSIVNGIGSSRIQKR